MTGSVPLLHSKFLSHRQVFLHQAYLLLKRFSSMSSARLTQAVNRSQTCFVDTHICSLSTSSGSSSKHHSNWAPTKSFCSRSLGLDHIDSPNNMIPGTATTRQSVYSVCFFHDFCTIMQSEMYFCSLEVHKRPARFSLKSGQTGWPPPFHHGQRQIFHPVGLTCSKDFKNLHGNL